MSNSIIILKKIEYFSYKNVLYQIQQAAKQANLFCIFIHSYFDDKGFKDLDGTLSEVNKKQFIQNYKNEIYTKQCSFNIYNPTEFSEDSFTWLIRQKGYFWAFDLQQHNNEYEFIFRFLSEYFKNNQEDYLWFDDADWYYSAKEILFLNRIPYNPKWTFKKIP